MSAGSRANAVNPAARLLLVLVIMQTFHTACPTLDFRPAFYDFVEGAELFHRIARAAGPALLALCVMPDHVHLIAHAPVRRRVRGALSGYTRWRHHRRGEAGRLFAGVPEPVVRTGGDKNLRDQRYTELNPCRAGLATDPLSWPLSTWRDRMGLAWPPVRHQAQDVARWHAYATRDDYVRSDPLPCQVGDRDAVDVIAAVSSVMRVPTSTLTRRGPARTLLVASLRRLTPLSADDIAALTHMTAAGVRKVDPGATPGCQIIDRVAGDPRFVAIEVAMPDTVAYGWRQRRNARGPAPGWQ